MILDATAGNRTMWKKKTSPYILYIDVEEELSYPPDIFIDSRNTGLEDESYNAIFFDPPHEFGRTKNTSIYTTPNREICNEKWPEWAREGHPRYYGADKYKTKKELKEYIYYSQKEFYRIMKEDGMLWLKWSENQIELDEILNIMCWWEEYLRIPIKSVSENTTPSYWVALMKREGLVQQNL